MRRYAWFAPLVGALGCGNVHSSRPDAPLPDDAAPGDGPAPDAMPHCDPSAKFGPLMLVTVPGRTGLTAGGGSFRLSADELSLYFSGAVATAGDNDLYVASRASITSAFQNPAKLALPNSGANDFDPATSADDKSLWFSSFRATGEGQHLYLSTRASAQVEFGQAAKAATVNATDVTKNDFQPFLSADGAELWFVSSRASVVSTDGSNLWHATRSGAGFAPPVEADELNTTAADRRPVLSSDRLTIYWSSDRPGTDTKGGFDVWTAHRNSVTEKFTQLQVVGEVNTASNDNVGSLSADQCRLYLYNDTTTTTNEVYVAVRSP